MKESIPVLARELGIADHVLLEQDVRLHQLLHYLTQESGIREHLLFKGGTCLIKCHLDYPRFSVDLDFTWRGRADWAGATSSTVREVTRQARNEWRDAMSEAATRFDYSFGADSIVWGSSSRMGTAQLGFTNLKGGVATVKVQVNFVEPLAFEPMKRPARSLISRSVPKAVRLLPGSVLDLYRKEFELVCYGPKEIAAEKCRAILTRLAPKGRDVLDLFLLERDLGIHAEDLSAEVRKKLDFALGLGKKYALNFDDAPQRLQELAEQDIRPLLLKEIDEEAFEAYRGRLLEHLRGFLR